MPAASGDNCYNSRGCVEDRTAALPWIKIGIRSPLSRFAVFRCKRPRAKVKIGIVRKPECYNFSVCLRSSYRLNAWPSTRLVGKFEHAQITSRNSLDNRKIKRLELSAAHRAFYLEPFTFRLLSGWNEMVACQYHSF